MTTAAPFYLYERPMLEAGVAAGKHYADIAGDREPATEALLAGEVC